MYAVSKLAEIAFAFLTANEQTAAGSAVLVNAMCPGYVFHRNSDTPDTRT